MISDQEIVNMYLSGLSSRKIADKTMISSTQIRRILDRNNIEKRTLKTDTNIENDIFKRYINGENSEALAKEFKINPSTICRIIKRLGGIIRPPQENKRKYKIEHSYFKTINTETKAYFLGFLMADGCVHQTHNSFKLEVHEQDIDILEKLINVLFLEEKPKIGTDRTIYKYIDITSKTIKDDLIKYGCVPNKTFKLDHIPEINHLNHFLRGFFDGDGCIYISPENRITIIFTGYTRFLECINEYLNKNNINTNLSLVKENVSELRICKQYDCIQILNLLYKNCTIYLNRKYSLYQKSINILNIKSSYKTSQIIKYNNNELSKDNILKMSLQEKNDAALFVLDYLRQNGFPYPKFTEEELLLDFDNLKKSIGIIDGQEIKKISYAGLKIFKNFSPHFFEVKSTSRKSMVEAFEDDKLLLSVIKNRMGITYKETFNITGNMIRQGFKNSFKAFASSIFKPSLAKIIYDNLAPKDSVVLDISAGFGQRLLGAMSSKNVKKYIGIDPWEKQIKSLEEVSKLFKFENVEFHCIGSEDFVTKEVDFCFSSPPFFNKEIYSNESSQAYSSGMESFITWWKLTCKNVHTSLKDNGLFVLNMDDEMGKKLLELSKDYFKLENTLYVNYQRKHLGNDGIDKFFILRKL